MSTSDDLNKSAKNPWNQIFMQHDYHDGQKSEDYKISSSLKTIWNDASDSKQISSNRNADDLRRNVSDGSNMQVWAQPSVQSVQYGSNVVTVGNSIQSKFAAEALGSVSDNTLKGRAITSSRNGNHMASFNNENQRSYSSPMSDSSLQQQSQPLEAFLQKVQVIVKNGFLDPKILNEPISPDTFDCINMLIYYVMEYKQTQSYANCDNNPALCAEVKNIFYKINLIQNEIAKCQLHYVQQTRIEQEILKSFAQRDGPYFKQQNFGSRTSSNQQRQQMATNRNGQCGQVVNNVNNMNAWSNVNASRTENYDRSNQRFNQRSSFDRNAQQMTNPFESSSAKFAFLPKAKNVDKRSHLSEQNRNFAQRDGNSTTN